ncbi:MAG: winged helix-turn-helix domain-containing protein [Sphaerochaetaceae bacterium]
MEVKSKLYLVDADGEKFMGIGVYWLLQRVESEGSLRAAASSMEISYSKAYGMVRNLENQLLVPVVDRRKGGAAHDGSSLTPFGRRFLALYNGFQLEAKERLVEPFEKFDNELKGLLHEYAKEPVDGEQ